MSKLKLAVGIMLVASIFSCVGNFVAPECPEPVAHPVSQRFIYIPYGCAPDFPQFALVCHFIDKEGNHVIHTRF